MTQTKATESKNSSDKEIAVDLFLGVTSASKKLEHTPKLDDIVKFVDTVKAKPAKEHDEASLCKMILVYNTLVSDFYGIYNDPTDQEYTDFLPIKRVDHQHLVILQQLETLSKWVIDTKMLGPKEYKIPRDAPKIAEEIARTKRLLQKPGTNLQSSTGVPQQSLDMATSNKYSTLGRTGNPRPAYSPGMTTPK